MVHLPDKYTDPHRERHKTIINDIKNERGGGFSQQEMGQSWMVPLRFATQPQQMRFL